MAAHAADPGDPSASYFLTVTVAPFAGCDSKSLSPLPLSPPLSAACLRGRSIPPPFSEEDADRPTLASFQSDIHGPPACRSAFSSRKSLKQKSLTLRGKAKTQSYQR